MKHAAEASLAKAHYVVLDGLRGVASLLVVLFHLFESYQNNSATLCVIVVFPFIVCLGAGEQRADGVSIRVARFFGDLSYPLYITHYPLIYIYAAWALRTHPGPFRGVLLGALTLTTGVLVAYFALKLYDLPVRRWLSRRFLSGFSHAVH